VHSASAKGGESFYELYEESKADGVVPPTLQKSVESGITVRRLSKRTPPTVVRFLLKQGNDYQDGEENSWIQILNEVQTATWIAALILA
jgi:hypothetical protein